jgi:uncharacterized protein YdeI (YjbR/CyaY-like superfamily)
MKQVYVTTRKQWRDWLSRHHDKSNGIWLVFCKKHTGRVSLEYDAAVEEALCFGWIDSIIKRIDDDRYARKMTPRKPNSRWSALNKKRVARLQRGGVMTKAGAARVAEARKSGLWEISSRPSIPSGIPKALQLALTSNKKAKTFFDQLAPSYQRQFTGWIAVAKREETRARRIKESLSLLEQGKKLGMK